MNAASFIEYLGYLFPDPIIPNTILLIFDSARCHTAKDVKEYLTSRGILYVIIPGGMTGFCQPADFGWFVQLKIKLSKSIDEWKHAGSHQFTRGGRVTPPAPGIVAAWLTDAWEIVQQSTVKVSFTRCALGSDAELRLSRHERLGKSFLQKLGSQGGEQIQVDSLQDILDAFDDLLVVDEL